MPKKKYTVTLHEGTHGEKSHLVFDPGTSIQDVVQVSVSRATVKKLKDLGVPLGG